MAKRNSRLPGKPVPEEIEATVRGAHWPEPGAPIYGMITREPDGALLFRRFEPAKGGGEWVTVKEAAKIMKARLNHVYKLADAGVLACKRRYRNCGMRISLGSIQDWLRAGGRVGPVSGRTSHLSSAHR